MRTQLMVWVMVLTLAAVFGMAVNADFAQDPSPGPAVKKTRREKLVVALVPEKNVFEQRKRYRYITDYLSLKLGRDVQIDMMPSFGQICDAFVEGKADVGSFGSFSYVLTRAKANIEPLARPVWEDGSSTYCGYIFSRRDSGIRTVEQMKGRILALVDRATTAGYIFPLFYFKSYGIKRMEDYFSTIYLTGNHDAAAWSVYIGESDVGACNDLVYNTLAKEYPDFKEQMMILARSADLPSNTFAVRTTLENTLKTRLRDLLLQLDKTPEGRAVLQRFGAMKFMATTDDDYSMVYQMVGKLDIDLNTYSYNKN